MAQLPPKVPTMAAPNWPSFPHQKIPSMGSLSPPASQNPTWVDEFLDFSSAKRGTHRRSASDSIAFFEAPDECRNSGGAAAVQPPGSVNDFDRFDDEQLMSMFSDAIAPTVSSSNPSTPSDHYSFNEDQKTTTIEQKQQQQNQQHQHQHHPKNESEEVESICKSEQLQQPSNTTSNDRIIDPKRVKRWDLPSFSSVMQSHHPHPLHPLYPPYSRMHTHTQISFISFSILHFLPVRILANRQSAQRSRVRKLQYISELERSVTSLQVCNL